MAAKKSQRNAAGKMAESASGREIESTSGAKCCCGPPGFGGGPTFCDSCLPCAFDVSFTDPTYADRCALGEAAKVIGEIGGPYRLYRVGPCLYIHYFPNFDDLDAGDWEARWQTYTGDGCETEVTTHPGRLPAHAVVLDFSDGFRPSLSVWTVPFCIVENPVEGAPDEPVAYLFFDGVGVPTCDASFSIYNQLLEDKAAYSNQRDRAIAWGGSATITRVGGCSSNRSATGNAKRYLPATSTKWVSLFDNDPLPAGSYNVNYTGGALDYGDGFYRINRSPSRKYKIVKQDPTTLVVTEIDAAPGSTEAYDSIIHCMQGEAGATGTFTADGTSLYGIWLDDSTDEDNVGGGPTFCICFDGTACEDNDQCHPGCWKLRVFTDDSGGAVMALPAGNYTLYYSAGAVQYNPPNVPPVPPQYRVNHFDAGTRGFQVVVDQVIAGDCDDPCAEATFINPFADPGCPGANRTILANAPGLNDPFVTMDLAQAGSTGLSVSVVHPGGFLGVRFINTVEGTYIGDVSGWAEFIVCIEGVLPPDPPTCVWYLWTATLDETGLTWDVEYVEALVAKTNPYAGTTENHWTLSDTGPPCVMKYVRKICFPPEVENPETLPPPADPAPPTEIPDDCACADCSQCTDGDYGPLQPNLTLSYDANGWDAHWTAFVNSTQVSTDCAWSSTEIPGIEFEIICTLGYAGGPNDGIKVWRCTVTRTGVGDPYAGTAIFEATLENADGTPRICPQVQGAWTLVFYSTPELAGLTLST